ncbi:hypothetical protein PIB30_009855 [Stylosanthes scabra]|uniref:Uncharacterized protein n=1 Tax=Stylosanthes scabra TaxID=79078 RepID=A0ABU6Q657_9FABA|nr:hypothetical protein [Stylosanthes scabra]
MAEISHNNEGGDDNSEIQIIPEKGVFSNDQIIQESEKKKGVGKIGSEGKKEKRREEENERNSLPYPLLCSLLYLPPLPPRNPLHLPPPRPGRFPTAAF